jgi:hypothetical protein
MRIIVAITNDKDESLLDLGIYLLFVVATGIWARKAMRAQTSQSLVFGDKRVTTIVHVIVKLMGLRRAQNDAESGLENCKKL